MNAKFCFRARCREKIPRAIFAKSLNNKYLIYSVTSRNKRNLSFSRVGGIGFRLSIACGLFSLITCFYIMFQGDLEQLSIVPDPRLVSLQCSSLRTPIIDPSVKDVNQEVSTTQKSIKLSKKKRFKVSNRVK